MILHHINITSSVDSLPIYYTKKLGKFLHKLIRAVSDAKYVKKITKGQQLIFYEDLNHFHRSIIDQDYFNNMLSKFTTNIPIIKKRHLPEYVDISEFQIYEQIMEETLISLNESNYLDQIMAGYYMSRFEEYLTNSLDEYLSSDENDILTVANVDSKEFKIINTYIKNSLHRLMKWFIKIYECKYIFGDLSFKYHNFRF
ncbi:hypothetical protein RF11_10731 [Thelohanellus kitauei]|uniref:Uncharacterized protein n=1 Tax=Thelohanellus kitauei TaxID=669202 RepID=A0A0C2J8U2_THEKT|nr:hypothetical protein RF11_10731 [Thelohanellus kitauei]